MPGHPFASRITPPARQRWWAAGRAAGLRVAAEIFADRAYLEDGSLKPRNQPGAMIADARVAVAQVVRLAAAGADTVCLHGDGPQAVFFARKLREALAVARVEIKAFGA